jgi:hypothetical protein
MSSDADEGGKGAKPAWVSNMDKADECKARAEEAERTARDPKRSDWERQEFEQIAREWRALEAASRRRDALH